MSAADRDGALRTSQQLLEEERARYRALFELAPDAYVVTDAGGTIHEANRAAAALLGLPADRLVGTALTARLAPPAVPRFADLLATVGAGQPVDDVRLQLIGHGNGGVPVSISGAPWRGKAGYLLWLIHDISERVREEEQARRLAAEQAARREAESARERIANILESISDAFVALDHDARITYLNRRAEQLLRRSRGELLGRVAWDEFPELRGTVLEREYRRATERGVSVSIEEYYPPQHGWVELHAFPTPDGLTVYFRNITGRKRAEANQRFLAEASTALAATIDYEKTLDTVVQLAVPHIADSCVLYLLSDEGAVERVEVAHEDPTGLDRLRDALRRALPGPHPPGSPVARVIETGTTELIPEASEPLLRDLATSEVHLQALREFAPRSLLVVPLVSRGRTFGVLCLGCSAPRARYTEADAALAEELAARAALAIDNARLYVDAQHAAQARQELLHVVSHDLRNSLNAALLHIDVLLAMPEAERSAKGRRQVEAVQRAAQQMQRMVQDLLDAEIIETGRFSIRPEPVQVLQLVEQALDTLRPLADERSQQLRLELVPDLPRLHADPGRLQQVLANLVGNAIKFSDPGGRIEVAVDPPRTGRELRFRVTDTGPGIAPADLPHIFERYWQGTHGRALGRGTGLGLTIARGIVEAHGGRIWVESVPAQGSTFHFTLPVRGNEAEARESPATHDPQLTADD